MKDEKKLDYLDDERKKLWARLLELEEMIANKTPEYESDARGASRKAVEHKNKTEEARTAAYQNLEAIKAAYEQVEQFRILSEANSQQISGYLEQYNTNAAEISKIEHEVEEQKKSVQSSIQEIDKLYADYDTYTEKIKKLKDIFITGDDYDTKLATLNQSMLSRKKEIDALYYDIIGYTDTDKTSGEEIKIRGKKVELEDAYNKVKEKLDFAEKDIIIIQNQAHAEYISFETQKEGQFKTAFAKWEADFTATSKKIDSLLPNALTAGLSSAFSKKKEDEIAESRRYADTFSKAIWGLVAVSLIPFAVSIISLIEKETLAEVLLRLPRLVLSILPLYIPVLWVAYSANRKVNLSKRLSEEYAHKEVLSKTFEGLSEQINNIENKDISVDLRNRLLFNLLEVSSENPGKLISDYNKSDHPLMDALDKSVKLANAVEKLGKIPGFSKLVKVLDKKSKNILEGEDKRAAAGFETLEEEEQA